MTNYNKHIIFGIIFATLFVYINHKYALINISFTNLIISAPILFVYSILPDIDISSSKISTSVRIIGLIILLVTVFLDMKTISIPILFVLLMMHFFKHRGFIHTISAGLILSLPLIYFNAIVSLFAFLGYFSHLLIDRKVKFI